MDVDPAGRDRRPAAALRAAAYRRRELPAAAVRPAIRESLSTGDAP